MRITTGTIGVITGATATIGTTWAMKPASIVVGKVADGVAVMNGTVADGMVAVAGIRSRTKGTVEGIITADPAWASNLTRTIV